jgi:hypothetical protein
MFIAVDLSSNLTSAECLQRSAEVFVVLALAVYKYSPLRSRFARLRDACYRNAAEN